MVSSHESRINDTSCAIVLISLRPLQLVIPHHVCFIQRNQNTLEPTSRRTASGLNPYLWSWRWSVCYAAPLLPTAPEPKVPLATSWSVAHDQQCKKQKGRRPRAAEPGAFPFRSHLEVEIGTRRYLLPCGPSQQTIVAFWKSVEALGESVGRVLPCPRCRPRHTK